MSAATTHATLAPSAAKRWINCPPSVALTAALPDTQSSYAAEGTLAHALAELYARRNLLNLTKRKFDSERAKLEKDPLFAPEMTMHVAEYVDYLKMVAMRFKDEPHIALEVRVDMREYIRECFGTIDCVMVGGSAIHIIDFKYGQGVAVDATENPQLMLYALGAYACYGMLYEIEEVHLHIVQPRLNSISEWAVPITELLDWAADIKPASEQALAGEGEYRAGDWCRFCKARRRCRARNTTPEGVSSMLTPIAPTIDNREIADRIRQLRPLVKVLADLEETALAECLAGNEVPGFKAVEGRAIRAWTDAEQAFSAATAAGIPEEMLYERKPLTLAGVEKLMGKKPFNEALGRFVHTPPGKPTLVDAGDKRPAITGLDAANEFSNVQEV